jgi:hypothetical protein
VQLTFATEPGSKLPKPLHLYEVAQTVTFTSLQFAFVDELLGLLSSHSLGMQIGGSQYVSEVVLCSGHSSFL